MLYEVITLARQIEAYDGFARVAIDGQRHTRRRVFWKNYTKNYTKNFMATIQTWKTKYGTSYRASVYVKGRRESATFDSKAKA